MLNEEFSNKIFFVNSLENVTNKYKWIYEKIIKFSSLYDGFLKYE